MQPVTGSEGEVDLTLVDEMQTLTVEERLRHNDRMIAQIRELRRAFGRRDERADDPPAPSR